MLKQLVATCAAATALFMLSAAPASASVGDFLGTWTATNAGTDGITRVEVTRTGATLRMRVHGQCTPSDCDWGTVNATAYAPNAGANLESQAIAIAATFNQSFARKIVILRRNGANLTYEVFTQFTDGSGRTHYFDRGQLRRALAVAPGVVGAIGAVTPAVAEDCVGFTPGNLRVVNIGGRWKIVDGSHWVGDFGANRAAAERGLAIIRRYGFTMQCFVARPNPPMTYWRRGANVPRLATGPGEDCINVNPANVRARFVSGAWKVVDGNSWLLHFGSNRAGAEQAAALIQRYNMNRQCFVARPNPPMSYWLSR